LGDDVFSTHGAKFAFVAALESRRIARHFLVTNHERVGDLLCFSFADLFAERLVALIYLNADSCSFKLREYLPANVLWASAIGRTRACTGLEPSREDAVVVLKQDCDAALKRAGDSRVDHHDALLLALFIDAGEVKALGQVHVELDSRNLPLAAGSVFAMKSSLGP
jgi:hypothetical protein